MKSTPGKSKDHTAKTTKILDCVCSHPFQDGRYGVGKRVHNPANNKVYRCTVCGRAVTLGERDKE